jgi:hypothetical protein
MQFGDGARRLRSLQAEAAATSEFELDFRVRKSYRSHGDSFDSASSNGVMAATALVMACALALI